MAEHNSSSVIRLATVRPLKNEQDTLFTNINGTVMKVYNAPIIRALSQGLGIPFEIVMPEDNGYGIKKSDGTWSGLIGMLVRGEADMTMSGVTPNKERREVVNFTFPLCVSEVSFMANKPEPSPKNFAIFEVFSFEVWISIGICLLVISFILYILMKKKRNYSSVLIAVTGNLLEESYPFEIRRRSVASLMLFWFLSTTILTVSYKAVILSAITFPRLVGIRDISDLAKAAKERSVKCISYKGGIPSVRWFESNDSRLKEIGECMKRAEMESLYSKPTFLNYTNKKVFIADRLDLYTHSRDYFISDVSFSLTHIGIAYSRNFCCSRKLESVVHRIIAADLYGKNLRDRHYMARLRMPLTKNPGYDRSRVLSLTLEDLSGSFLVLLIGYMFSFFVLIVEILVKKVRI